jgi:photosystem II stability/assembly factor-like uncharacterized protein
MSLLLLTACSAINDGGSTVQQAPTAQRVNGFGSAANHPHSLLVFPNKVVILTTHYGLFRSDDSGASWKMVAAGPGQLMDNLMTYSLVKNPRNPQRLYVLAQPVDASPRGTAGLYTSDDQGRTWKLMAKAADLMSATNIYLVAAGNNTAEEVYIYLREAGPSGLKVSLDAGEHFTNAGKLPFGTLTCLLAIPETQGQLLAGSSEGLVRSTDRGTNWEKVKGITGAVFELVASGPGGPIYASGDTGISVSHDGGQTFTAVYTKFAMGSLTVSPTQPQVLYGRTGTAIYRSSDGGRTWASMPRVKGNLFNLAIDPGNAEQVYLSLSYPTELYRFDAQSKKWIPLTPKA